MDQPQSYDLLNNMYNFYKGRYSANQSEMEEKFNNAVEDLIGTGDISKTEYISFCVTHDIEPRIKKKTTSSSSSSSDPCGHSYASVRGC